MGGTRIVPPFLCSN